MSRYGGLNHDLITPDVSQVAERLGKNPTARQLAAMACVLCHISQGKAPMAREVAEDSGVSMHEAGQTLRGMEGAGELNKLNETLPAVRNHGHGGMPSALYGPTEKLRSACPDFQTLNACPRLEQLTGTQA